MVVSVHSGVVRHVHLHTLEERIPCLLYRILWVALGKVFQLMEHRLFMESTENVIMNEHIRKISIS